MESLKIGAKQFSELLKKESFFRVYSHLDADGLSSAAIMIKFLKSQGKQFQLSIIEQLTDDEIKKISPKGCSLILLDFGSGQLEKLNEIINGRQVIIIDHHQVQGKIKHDNLIHVNPCLDGVDGGTKVSASGMTYLFLKNLGAKSDSASIALIGAKGDLQELDSTLNASILKDSTLEERQDLNVYGLNTRPVHKALEYSNEGFIPGVSGSETASVNFLNDLNISLKNGDDWRTINDLSSNEKQDLISGIIVKRSELDQPANIFRSVYELSIGRKRSIDEWAAMLNACGRMNMPSLGISALLNPSYEQKVEVVLKSYRNIIAEGLQWLENNFNNPEFVKQTKRALYFIAGNKINYKIIGTLCSIKNNDSGKEFIIGLAESDNIIKVSVRKSGSSDLKASDLIIKAVKGIGEGGGHAQAAGANIKKGSEQEFINNFEKVLKGELI
ncbi:MAG: DHH family phosphoesterase [Candidatus Nanoarchaeia archaeon]|jgi:RecJ-like exonuclease